MHGNLLIFVSFLLGFTLFIGFHLCTCEFFFPIADEADFIPRGRRHIDNAEKASAKLKQPKAAAAAAAAAAAPAGFSFDRAAAAPVVDNSDQMAVKVASVRALIARCLEGVQARVWVENASVNQ
jgi:hypothetical protein